MSLRKLVFWPPFLLLLASLLFCLIDGDGFFKTVSTINSWILNTFDGLFTYSALFMLLTCIGVYFSKLGSIRIGGADAKPILSRWRWFSITLCTTVAIGILFWASAEPLYHLHGPPKSLGLAANSAEAARFSLATMFMHWSFIPYAIYAVPALTFALVYFNMNRSFSLSSTLFPLLGRHTPEAKSILSSLIDGVCLFALVAGMAASLGAGILTLVGAGKEFFGVTSNPMTLGVVALMIVGAFTASAASGLMKGIRILSDLNAKIFFGLAITFLFFGPTKEILSAGGEAFASFIVHFFDRSLFYSFEASDNWPRSWTVFYWANWLAWAPITALFLGRIAYGYTVREFLQTNLLAPALFSCFWMVVFSGTSLSIDQSSNGLLHQVLQKSGPESVIYEIIKQFPLAGVLTVVFVFTSFLSYVTAADSNTEAMGGISMSGLDHDSPSPPVWIKLSWGLTVGTVAWVMVSFAGIDGIKMLSNLGGLPALFLVTTLTFSLIRLAWRPGKLEG